MPLYLRRACAAVAAAAAVGCANEAAPPSVVQNALGTRQVAGYRQEALDGVPTLVLEYKSAGDFLAHWESIESTVEKVVPVLEAEADRRQLLGVRILITTAHDYTTFDFRRSDAIWKEVRRDLVEVRKLPDGARIGLRPVEQRGPWMWISYVTELDLKADREAVRDQAAQVLSLFCERVDHSGVHSVMVSPSDRLRGGVSIGLAFEKDDASGRWKPAS